MLSFCKFCGIPPTCQHLAFTAPYRTPSQGFHLHVIVRSLGKVQEAFVRLLYPVKQSRLLLCSFSISLGWDTKREAVFGYVAQYLQTASHMDLPIMWLHLVSNLSYAYVRYSVSFDAAKLRVNIETAKYFSKFFRGCFDIPYFIGYKIILLQYLLKQNAKQNVSKISSKTQANV